MAFTAAIAEFPVVYVVTPVTVDTAPGALVKAFEGRAVTGLAMNFAVRIPERETRRTVVELPDQPVVRIVTLGTATAEAALVDVIFAMAVNTLCPRFCENWRAVASLAAERCVLPYQRKTAEVVIESNVFEPAPVVVTTRAGFAQPALVRVVLPVATVTIGFQFAFFHSVDMAGFANQPGVPALQRKVGVGSVIEARHVPTLDFVAIAAVFTVRPLVNIFVAVAAVTIAHLAVELRRLVARRVAAVTGLLAMPAEQWVIGISQVIEVCLLPGLYRVALLALVAEAISVDVSYRVTVTTLLRRFLVLTADVAGIAGHALVGRLEFETGLIVIEAGFIPAFRGMALGAFLAQVSRVCIVFGMAAVTIAPGLAVGFILDVAG